MKLYSYKAIALLCALFILSACSEDQDFKEVKVTPVEKFNAPAANETVQLINDKSITLSFEWEAATADDSGYPLYEVLFDKKGGDFSNPVHRQPSDNNSAKNYAKISHTDLDNICSLAGINPGETVTLIWTVTSTRGLNQVLAKEIREVTLKRY